MSDEGQTDLEGMGMGVLRWLLGSHRSNDEDEEDERERAGEWKRGKRSRRSHPPNTYRIEVDGEARQMRGESPPFSFWGSSRVILILSFLLWWVQPAGPMIAGYVGGRRAGSPMKGVLAALLPVVVILIANVAYARDLASRQIDFVASLPDALAGGAATILPFLLPYKDFLVGYMTGFVKALQSTFGMGTNGYLMVIIFAYIGGVIADQTRRELYYRSGASQSVGLNLIQPLFGGRHPAQADEYEEEDEELREFRRPSRARTRARGYPTVAHSRGRRRRHGTPNRFEDFRKVNADPYEERVGHRGAHVRARDEYEENEEEEEVSAPLTHHLPRVAAKEQRGRAAADEEEDVEAVARREAQEARRPRERSHDEEVAIQRFVERALRHYEHPTR